MRRRRQGCAAIKTVPSQVQRLLEWSRWGDPHLTLPYRSANLEQPGLNLLKVFDDTAADAAHDRDLVDGWARRLGLAGWYEWVPYRLDEA